MTPNDGRIGPVTELGLNIFAREDGEAKMEAMYDKLDLRMAYDLLKWERYDTDGEQGWVDHNHRPKRVYPDAKNCKPGLPPRFSRGLGYASLVIEALLPHWELSFESIEAPPHPLGVQMDRYYWKGRFQKRMDVGSVPVCSIIAPTLPACICSAADQILTRFGVEIGGPVSQPIPLRKK